MQSRSVTLLLYSAIECIQIYHAPGLHQWRRKSLSLNVTSLSRWARAVPGGMINSSASAATLPKARCSPVFLRLLRPPNMEAIIRSRAFEVHGKRSLSGVCIVCSGRQTLSNRRDVPRVLWCDDRPTFSVDLLRLWSEPIKTSAILFPWRSGTRETEDPCPLFLLYWKRFGDSNLQYFRSTDCPLMLLRRRHFTVVRRWLRIRPNVQWAQTVA